MRSTAFLLSCPDLNEAIEFFTNRLSFDLDMIAPADSPTEALLSKGGESIRLVLSRGFSGPNGNAGPTKVGTQNDWVTGRAGMEYRDLIPGRMDGRVIASHIRLTKGGEVPDYVHYHKVEFQMIYCLAGSIRVVYEDQGDPFWLNPGDCVLQPPEIRHRVLECTAGSDVLEVSMPAVHETWVEHEIELPTREVKAERNFGGQHFIRHIASDTKWRHNGGREFRDTGIAVATNRFADVRVLRIRSEETSLPLPSDGRITFCFVLKGNVTLKSNSGVFAVGDGFTLSRGDDPQASAGTELVYVSIRA